VAAPSTNLASDSASRRLICRGRGQGDVAHENALPRLLRERRHGFLHLPVKPRQPFALVMHPGPDHAAKSQIGKTTEPFANQFKFARSCQ